MNLSHICQIPEFVPELFHSFSLWHYLVARSKVTRYGFLVPQVYFWLGAGETDNKCIINEDCM